MQGAGSDDEVRERADEAWRDRLAALLEEQRALLAADPLMRLAAALSSTTADPRAKPPQAAAAPGTVMRAGAVPPGVMRAGSATHAVYEYLTSRRAQAWVQRHQIVAATGRSHKAIDWALIFLRHIGLVEARHRPDNERYFQYRLTSNSSATNE